MNEDIGTYWPFLWYFVFVFIVLVLFRFLYLFSLPPLAVVSDRLRDDLPRTAFHIVACLLKNAERRVISIVYERKKGTHPNSKLTHTQLFS